MPTPKAKPALLLAALAISAALAGCGGGSNESTETSPAPDASADRSSSQEESSSARLEARDAVKADPSGARKGKADERTKGAADKEARDLARQLGKSGTAIPADSPVAQKILGSLAQGKSGKKEQGGAGSATSAIEEVVSGSRGKDDSGQSVPPSERDSIDEALKQLEEQLRE